MARSHMIGVRVSDREYGKIRLWAETRGVTVTEFVRQAIEAQTGELFSPRPQGVEDTTTFEFEHRGDGYVVEPEWWPCTGRKDEALCCMMRIQRSSGESYAAFFSISGLVAVVLKRQGLLDPGKVQEDYMRRLPDLIDQIIETPEGEYLCHMFTSKDRVMDELVQ